MLRFTHLLQLLLNPAQLEHHEVETALHERMKDMELLKSRASILHTNHESLDTKLAEVRNEFAAVLKDFELERDNGINFYYLSFLTLQQLILYSRESKKVTGEACETARSFRR